MKEAMAREGKRGTALFLRVVDRGETPFTRFGD